MRQNNSLLASISAEKEEPFPSSKANILLKQIFELQDPRHARLLPMEGLRGLAVSLVFLQHYGVQAELLGVRNAAASAFRNYGNQGVELFFVLSGYLIYGHLLQRQPAFGAFMARRCQRLYPAFLVVFAVALAIGLAVPAAAKLPAGPGAAVAVILANLAFLPGLFPIPRIVDVAWSLSYEMFFYLATAVFVLGTAWPGLAPRLRIFGLLILSASFLGISAVSVAGFPVRMMPFFAGMLLAEGAGAFVPAWLGWAAPMAAGGLYLAGFLPGAADEFCQTVGFFALCAVCFRGTGRVSAAMRWAPLRWLGNMSYSYYLVHGFVVRFVMLALGHATHGAMPGCLFWVFLPLLYGATLLSGAALFIVVEKPFSLTARRRAEAAA